MSAGKPKVGAEVVEEQGGGKLQAKRAIDHGARWARYGASILLLIVVSFGSYFFIYVAGRSDRLDQYNLRLLSTAAQNVGDVLLGREEIARSAAKSVLEPKREGSETAPDVYRKPSVEELESKRALIPHVVRIKGGGELEVWPPEAANAKRREPEIAVKAFLADWTVDPELRFVFHGAEHETKPIEDDGPLVWSAKLRDLLEPTLPSEVFDIVAVARGDRTVLLQKGRSKLHLSQVPSGKSAETAEDSEDHPEPNLTSIREVDFAGQKYRMYVQPFRVPIQLVELGSSAAAGVRGGSAEASGSPAESPWVSVEDEWLVVGLAPAASVRREALLIPPTIVIPVVGFLMLGVLILPYLRVRLIGPRETLRLADVLSLGVSVFLIASLLTTGLLYVHVRGQLSHEQDERLEQLSDAIEGRMHTELDALEDQLVELSEKRELSKAAPEEKPAERTDLLVDPELASLRFPFFQMAVWLDSAGQQGPKWTVEKSTTAAVKVPDRPYFRRARDYELWPGAPARGTKENGKPEFVPGRFVESIRSRTTGERLALLSKRIEAPPQGTEEGEIVATIVSRLLSAIGPTLPPDHGFAVLDRDGTVLFHAEEERNLHENFLEEVEPRQALEAALFGGEERSFGVEYRTRDLRLHVAPMAGTPWTLAVFVDQDVLRTQRLEILTLSVVLFVALLLVLLLVALWLHFTSRAIRPAGAARPTWFWPWKERRESYTVITLTMSATVLIWAVTMALGRNVDVRFPALQAVLALVLLRVVLQRESDRQSSVRVVLTGKARRARERSIAIDRAAGFVGLAVGALLALVAGGDGLRTGFIVAGLIVFALRRPSLLAGYLIALGVFTAGHGTWSALKIPSVIVSALYSVVLARVFADRRPEEREGDPESGRPPAKEDPARRRRRGVPLYLACGASVLVVISILPSITFFRAVYDEVGLLFAMREQLEFADALRARPSEILQRYDRTVTRKLDDASTQEGVPTGSVYALLPSSPSGSGDSDACPACWNVADAFDVYARIERPASDVATSAPGLERERPAPRTPTNELWLEALEVWNAESAPRASPCEACMEAVGVGTKPLRRAGARRPSVPLLAAFRETLPSYNALARSVRELADQLPTVAAQDPPVPADGSAQGVRWEFDHDGELSARIDAYRRPIEMGLAVSDAPAGEQDPPTRLRGLPEPEGRISLRVASVPTQFAFGSSGPWILAGCLALGALVWLLRSIAERAFLVHLRLPAIVPRPGRASKIGKRELVLRPDEKEQERSKSGPACLVLDSGRLRDEKVEQLVFEARAAGVSKVVVEDFEVGLREPAVARRKLELLEELHDLGAKDVVILSEMEPLHFFTGLDFDSQVIGTTAELNRWASILVHYEKRRGDAGDLEHEDRRLRLLEAIQVFTRERPAGRHLAEECWPDPALRVLGTDLAQSGNCSEFDREQIVDVVLDHAEAYYRTVFGGCSREERVVLYRLAQDGFVNWHVDETLRRLIRRGLVRYEAGFPLMNESFRRFVLFVESPADVREYEIEGSAGIWSRLRAPIIASLGVLGVFLYFTQRQSFDQTIGLVAALATGWPAVVSLLARLSRQPKA